MGFLDFGRRLWTSTGFVLQVMFCLPLSANAQGADMTAREVTVLFHGADRGAPVNLSGKDLSFLDLSGLDFKGAWLTGANLFSVDLTTANLGDSYLQGVKLDRAGLVGADFSGAKLVGASVMRPAIYTTLDTNVGDAPKFAGANQRYIRLTAMMDGADFRDADMTGAKLGPHEPRADISSMPASLLRGCDFSGAKLVGADLSDANLDGASLQGVRGLDLAKGLDSARYLDRAIR